jgi:hypothetical protein
MNKTKYFIAINVICSFSKNYRKNKYIDSKNLSEIKINFDYFKKQVTLVCGLDQLVLVEVLFLVP